MKRMGLTRRGFTLIELITVIAISSILLTIITIPIIQSFNITRAAQGFADAQDRARILIDQITREIGTGISIRDNSGLGGSVVVVLPYQPPAGAPVQTEILLPYSKIDIWKAGEGQPRFHASGALIDPDTGRADPTLRAPKGQVNLPAGAASRIVRYFVGLRKPLAGTDAVPEPALYNNPYDGLLMRRNSQGDNLYVLYRAEVDVRIWDPFATPPQWKLNPELFATITVPGVGVVVPDTDRDGLPDDIDDPFFFVLRDSEVIDPVRRDAKTARIKQWLRRSVVVTEISRYDMIFPIFDKRTRKVDSFTEPRDPTLPPGIGNPNQEKPKVVSLIQFTPTRLTSEPAKGELSLRPDEDTENPEKVSSEVMSTKYGGWASTIVNLWPARVDTPQDDSDWWRAFPIYSPPPGSAGTFLRGRRDPADGNLKLFHVDGLTQTPLFDVSRYQRLKEIRENPADPDRPGPDFSYRYPFSAALLAGASAAPFRKIFTPFWIEPGSGKLNFSFSIEEVGDVSAAPPLQGNIPTAFTGPTLTPEQEGDPGGTVWDDPDFHPGSLTSTINGRFNRLWHIYPRIITNRELNDRAHPIYGVKRFVDLRVFPQPDDTLSPLHPGNTTPAPKFGERAKIVPGSEVIIGPDQTRGPNYGNPVRYTRVAKRPVGPNQYLINYVPLAEPREDADLGVRYSDFGLAVPPDIYNPNTYVAANFIQAIIQPRFKAGYVEFNSNPNQPLPDGQIFIRYRFQLNEPKDVVAVDYDTSQVMQVLLTIRNYPQTSIPNPQYITVKGSATVKNFSR